jgi:hypothetical protein
MVTMSSGFMFAPHGPGGAHTKLTYGLHIDLKGWFNAFIQVSATYPPALSPRVTLSPMLLSSPFVASLTPRSFIAPSSSPRSRSNSCARAC